jgi:hypothetical protein
MLMDSWKTNFSVKADDFSKHVGSLVSIRVPVNKQFADVRNYTLSFMIFEVFPAKHSRLQSLLKS